MRQGSLCTGILGLDLAVAQHFGAELAWYSEIEPAPITVIEREHPGVPNLGDLKLIDWFDVEPVDIVTGGFPCQPFSHAGKRQGERDERHLWPYIIEALRVLRPQYAVFENVGGLLSVSGEFEEPEDRCVCGWPHRRGGLHRVFGRCRLHRDTHRRGDDQQGERGAVPPRAGVRREGQALSGGDGPLGEGTDLDGERRGGRCLPAPDLPGSDLETGAGPARSGDRGRAARAAEVADRSTVLLDRRGVRPLPGDVRADQGAEPEGSGASRPRCTCWFDGGCPACGRALGGAATRSVLRSGFGTVLGDLAEAGFDAEWCVLRASDVGAPHGRLRLFIVATDSDCGGFPLDAQQNGRRAGMGARQQAHRDDPAGRRDAATDASRERHGGGQDGRTMGRVDGRDAGEARERQRARSKSGDRSAAVASDAERNEPGHERGGRDIPDERHRLEEPVAPGRSPEAPADAAGQRRPGGVEPREDMERNGLQPALVGSGAGSRHPDTAWGQYEPAIRRWERILGRPAPRPVDDQGRLAPPFVEWMMGYPEGWVDGLTRTQALKALGNAVVPQQALAALGELAPIAEAAA